MKESILKFMNSVDHNGDWDYKEANEIPEAYMRETIENWLDDGMELNGRIKGYLDFLNQYV